MKKIIGVLLSLVLILTAVPVTHVTAANNMTVDCSSVIREATHCANGSLYGITENTPGDINSLVAPLHPFVFRNPARGGNGNQHPYGDAIKVAKRLSTIPGAKVSIDLADMLPYWPYQWPGMSSWLNQVKSFINDKKASGCTNWYFYKWYGDMTGNMVNVTPPNDNSALVDGAACVDKNNQYISFIFDGPNDGTIRTTFKNLPSFIGSNANVKVEKIDWVSKDTVSYGPKTVSNQNYAVVNGQITVSGGTYKLINRNSQKALGVDADSTKEGANVHQWTDNGKTSQQWKLVRMDVAAASPKPSVAVSQAPAVSEKPVVSSKPAVSEAPVSGVIPVVSVKTENNGNTITQAYTIEANGGALDLSKVKIVYTASGMSDTPQTVFM